MKRRSYRLIISILSFIILTAWGGQEVFATETGTEADEEFVLNYRDLPDEQVPESVSEYPEGYRRLLRSSATDSSYGYEQFKDFMPPLRNQNPYGSCWAQTSMALAEINLRKQGLSTQDLSVVHLAYFSYNKEVEDPIGGTKGDINRSLLSSNYLDSGGNIAFAGQVLGSWVGAAEAAGDLVYPSSSGSFKPSISQTLAYDDAAHLININEVYINGSSADRNAVKQLICANGGVGISYFSPSGTVALTGDGIYDSTHNAFYDPETHGGKTNHAVTIVGWDDSFPVTYFNEAHRPKNNGAWLIRNSWTTGSYNDNKNYAGYFWMSYENASIGDVAYSFEFEMANDYDHNYQYDGAMQTYAIGAQNQVKVANVFTAGGNELLKAVSFSSENSNLDYEIEIYKGLPKDNSLDLSGLEAASEQPGSVTYAGYHTIKLTKQVPLKEGERYAVVVTLKKSGKDVFIDTEYSQSSDWYDIKASASAGQSFNYNGRSWSDYGSEYNRNIRIKAFSDDNPYDELIVSVEQDGTLTYDGTDQRAVVNKESNAGLDKTTFTFCSSEEGEYTEYIPEFKNAGSHTVYYKATAEGYLDAKGQFTVTIGKKPISITWSTKDSWTYDGELHKVEATPGDICSGDSIDLTVKNNTATNAGSYTASVTAITGTGADNYSLPAEGCEKPFSIAKRSVTMKSGSISSEYKGTPITIDSVEDNKLGDGFLTEKGEGAEYHVTGSRTAPGTSKNTFTYTLKSGTLAGNYNIAMDYGTITVGWWDDTEIRNHVITVTANSLEVEYNGDVQRVSGLTDDSTRQEIEGEIYTVNGLSAEAFGTDADIYENRITGTAVIRNSANENVTDHFSIEKEIGYLVIDEKDIYDAYISLDNELVYNGYDQRQRFSVSVDGLDLYSGTDYDTNGDEAQSAGEHTITINGKGNYEGSASKKYTIQKAIVDIEWGDAEFTFDGNSHVPKATPKNNSVKGSDNLYFDVSGAASTAGTHTATVTRIYGKGSENYELPSDTSKTFTIKKSSSSSSSNSSGKSSSSSSSKNTVTPTPTRTPTPTPTPKPTAKPASGNGNKGNNANTNTTKSNNTKTGSAGSGNKSGNNATGSAASNDGSSKKKVKTAEETEETKDDKTDKKDDNKDKKKDSKNSSKNDEVKLESNEDTLKAVLGEEKFNELKDKGELPQVRLESKVIDPVPEKEKSIVEASIGTYSSTIPNLTVGEYYDVTLELNEEGEWKTVSNPDGTIQIVFSVPKDMREKAEAIFSLHLHDGEAKLLYDVDDDPDTATFNADGFSTFVLLYQAKETAAEAAPAEITETEPETVKAVESTPDTGSDNTVTASETASSESDLWRIWVLGAIILVVVAVVIIAVNGPKFMKKDK